MPIDKVMGTSMPSGLREMIAWGDYERALGDAGAAHASVARSVARSVHEDGMLAHGWRLRCVMGMLGLDRWYCARVWAMIGARMLHLLDADGRRVCDPARRIVRTDPQGCPAPRGLWKEAATYGYDTCPLCAQAQLDAQMLNEMSEGTDWPLEMSGRYNKAVHEALEQVINERTWDELPSRGRWAALWEQANLSALTAIMKPRMEQLLLQTAGEVAMQAWRTAAREAGASELISDHLEPGWVEHLVQLAWDTVFHHARWGAHVTFYDADPNLTGRTDVRVRTPLVFADVALRDFVTESQTKLLGLELSVPVAYVPRMLSGDITPADKGAP